MLTLAAVPLAAGAASVAQAAPATIRIADLDLTSAAGKAVFQHRAEAAAQKVCADTMGVSRRARCEAAVKEEARDKLAAVQQARIQRASL
jgi:UrcA family protein